MALDPASLFALAEQLLNGSQVNEAAARSAVNRSYYACHLTVRDRLYGLDAQRHGQRRPSHVAVVQAVGARLASKRGEELHRLKRMREVADYVRDSDHPEAQFVFGRESVATWPDLAGVALAVARDLLPLLRAMPVESAAEER